MKTFKTSRTALIYNASTTNNQSEESLDSEHFIFLNDLVISNSIICTEFQKGSKCTILYTRVIPFSITQLVDQCKSCILIGYATRGLLVIVIELQNLPVFLSFFSPNKYFFTLHLLTLLLLFCPTSWVILKQLDPSPSRATGK